MAIREPYDTDAAAIAELLDQLGYPQDGVETVADRLRQWRADPASAVFVWVESGDVTGVVAVHLCPFFERTGTWARITALVVARRARGQGAGAALVGAAEEFAREHGCLRMEVTSSRRRVDAHAFYRRLGYLDQCETSGRLLRPL